MFSIRTEGRPLLGLALQIPMGNACDTTFRTSAHVNAPHLTTPSEPLACTNNDRYLTTRNRRRSTQTPRVHVPLPHGHVPCRVHPLHHRQSERGAEMTRAEILDWTLEKNGLADAMAELNDGEQPTDAMLKALAEIESEASE